MDLCVDEGRESREEWIQLTSRDVAQSGSVPEWGSGGREFESRRPDHYRLRRLPFPDDTSLTSRGTRLAKRVHAADGTRSR